MARENEENKNTEYVHAADKSLRYDCIVLRVRNLEKVASNITKDFGKPAVSLQLMTSLGCS